MLGLGLGILLFAGLRGLNFLPLLLIAILVYIFYERGGLKVIQRRLGEDSAAAKLTGITFQQVGGQQTAKKSCKKRLILSKLTNEPKLWESGR